VIPSGGHTDAYSPAKETTSSSFPAALLCLSFGHQHALQLWLNLAIAEKELGLPIPDEAIEQMKANLVRPAFMLWRLFPRELD
jgi:adenylosuccinate lyase